MMSANQVVMPNKYTRRQRQRGQALVFVTVTVLVMVIAMMMTYSIGQLTNQKTRLQNTADAAAYSAALAQARDYNFSAYMNRAMIANDVSVAQQIALRSWVSALNETFKTGGLTNKYSPAGNDYAVAGPLYFLWNGPEMAASKAADGLEKVLKTFTTVYVEASSGINEVLSLTQKVYHYSTALTVAQTIGWIEAAGDKIGQLIGISSLGDIAEKFSSALNLGVESNVIKMNDPRARLSTLGLLAFINDTKNWLAFTENRNPVGPWGTDEEQTQHNVTTPGYWDGWNCENVHKGIVWCHWIDEVVTTVADRNKKDYTAAPLRDSTPDNMFAEYDGPSKNRYSNVVVSMLDDFSTDRNADWKFPTGLTSIGFWDLIAMAPPTSRPNNWAYKKLSHASEGITLWNDEKENTPAGTGLGYKKPGSWNRRWKTDDTVDLEGAVTFPLPIPFLPGVFVNPPGPHARLPYFNGTLGSGYVSAKGEVSTGDATGSSKKATHISDKPIFRKYRDVTDIEQGTDSAHQNWTSPPLLVEIERSTRTVATSYRPTPGPDIGMTSYSADQVGCVSEVSPSGQRVEQVFREGNFKIGDGSSSNCMRAMAKAEAYFVRPAELFAREDQKTEYGSLYSPYWQARLVKTTPTEQMISMIFQYCDGRGSLWACATELMKSAKAVNQTIWSRLSSFKSILD